MDRKRKQEQLESNKPPAARRRRTDDDDDDDDEGLLSVGAAAGANTNNNDDDDDEEEPTEPAVVAPFAAAGGGQDDDDDEEEDGSSIWEIDHLANHPALVTAIGIVRGKINRCLSSSFDIVDRPGTDHKEVLLNLPGRFGLGIDPENPEAYGYTCEEGIFVHTDLVRASDEFFAAAAKLGDPLELLDGFSYVAIMVETIEHELAHLKNHTELMGNRFSQSTHGDSPLKGESGFAVQKQIAEKYFPDSKAAILEVSGACYQRRFQRLLELRKAEFKPTSADAHNRTRAGGPLTLEQLKHWINYPIECDQNDGGGKDSGVNDKDNGPGSGGGDSNQGDDDDDDKNDGGGKPPARLGGLRKRPLENNLGRRGSQRRGGHVAKLDPPHNSTRQSKRLKHKKPSPITSTITDSNGDDPFLARDEADGLPIDDSCLGRNCVITAKFCDSNRKIKDTFSKTEDMYVLLTFENATAIDTYIPTYRSPRFGRCGIKMEIDGEPMSYGSMGMSPVSYVRLTPGSKHTFFRKFSVARHPKGQLLRTPQTPNTYMARVHWSWLGKYRRGFKFRITE